MSDYVHRRGSRKSERVQMKLFADAIGEQDCNAHGKFTPRRYWSDLEIESMMTEQGWIDCPDCLIEIAGVHQP